MVRVLLLLIIFISGQVWCQFKPNLNLEVYKYKKSKPSYSDFCRRYEGECDLSGDDIISFDKKLWQDLNQVNLAVNFEIKFVLDPENYGKEEYWNYPINGRGDCEDNALEKRRRLVELGYPRGALRMGSAFHKEKYYGHALLYVETDQGTYILDQDNPEILIWYQTPYIFEAREMTSGRWEYFVQDW